MLVECVSEANQTLYKDDVVCGGGNSEVSGAHWPASHYNRPLPPPLASQYRDPQPLGASAVRGRYIKKWLHSLYHQPHYAGAVPPNSGAPGAQAGWNPALWMFQQQQQQHFNNTQVKQETNPDAKEFPNPEKKLKDGGGTSAFAGQSAFLGPNIWEKTVPYTDDFNLEYMDLDEFLMENGAAENANMNASSSSPPLPQMSPEPTQGLNLSPMHPPLGVPLSPPHPQQHSPIMSPPMSSACKPDSPPLPPMAKKQQAQQQMTGELARYLTPSPSQSQCPPSPQASQPSPQQQQASSSPAKSGSEQCSFKAQDLALASIPVMDNMGDESCSEDEGDGYSSILNDSNLALVRVPGQESFDPRKRIFSEDELRPQPMIKKSRKVYVPEDLKDDKYWARRKKNNTAAKRSRDARRVKENQIALRAAFLEKQVETLQEKLKSALEENHNLQKQLEKYQRNG